MFQSLKFDSTLRLSLFNYQEILNNKDSEDDQTRFSFGYHVLFQPLFVGADLEV